MVWRSFRGLYHQTCGQRPVYSCIIVVVSIIMTQLFPRPLCSCRRRRHRPHRGLAVVPGGTGLPNLQGGCMRGCGSGEREERMGEEAGEEEGGEGDNEEEKEEEA